MSAVIATIDVEKTKLIQRGNRRKIASKKIAPRRVTEGDFILLCSGESIGVSKEWISRWGFLIDLVDDMGVNEVDWTYTSSETLKKWIMLNTRMDDSDPFEVGYSFIAMSEVWSIVEFMRPVTDNYLLHCYIDLGCHFEVRKRLYHALGKLIRQRGQRYPYITTKIMKRSSEWRYGIHHNFYLRHDLAYGVHNQGDVGFSAYPSKLQAIILEQGPNAITGVLHTAYVESIINKQSRKDCGSYEVPWYLIRWSDIVEMDIRYPHSINYIRQVIITGQIICEYSRGSVTESEVDRLALSFYREHLSQPQHDLPLLLTGRAILHTSSLSPSVVNVGERMELKCGRADMLMDALCRSICASSDEIALRLLTETQLFRLFMITPTTINADSGMISSIGDLTMHYATDNMNRFIDSSEYGEVCRRIANGMGRQYLYTLADIMIRVGEMTEAKFKTRIHLIIRPCCQMMQRRMVMFAEAAISIIEENPHEGYPGK